MVLQTPIMSVDEVLALNILGPVSGHRFALLVLIALQFYA